jgi:hypothetical protein
MSCQGLLSWLAMVSHRPSSCVPLPSCFLAQVSAVGVWGTPLEIAFRAADIVAALPTAQLLRRQYSSGEPSSVHNNTLKVIQDACYLMRHTHVVSPHMSREKLLGRCGAYVIQELQFWLQGQEVKVCIIVQLIAAGNSCRSGLCLASLGCCAFS